MNVFMDFEELLLVFLVSMTPIGELRLSIPLAIYAYDIPWVLALPIAVCGNIVPIVIMIFTLNRFSRSLKNYDNKIGQLFRWQEERVRKMQSDRFRKYGALTLIILVAVPLPMTGAWTGSLAAWIFRVPFWNALFLLCLGVLFAGILVTIITLTGIGIGDMFLATVSGQ